MLSVSYISPSFYPATKYGGPIYSTLNTCQELSNIGIKVFVSSTNAHVNEKLNVEANNFINFNKNLHVKYYNEIITGVFSFQLLLNLWKDIKKADVIHIQAIFNSPVPIALFYSKLFKKPTFLTPRGALANWGITSKRTLFKKLWLRFFIKPLIKNVFWHATSFAEKKDILSIFPKASVSVVPNGIKIDKNPPVYIGKSYYNKFTSNITIDPVIVSMGRLHKVKGFDILIKSFHNIKKQFTNAALFVAGGDEGELKYLHNLVSSLNLNDSVFFTGMLEGEDKKAFLANADIFVLPSHTENFGMVYAEALAMGTPVVASTNTPWEEVEGAGCGRWVTNTVEETSAAMVDLLNRDKNLLHQNCIKYIQKFDWNNIAQQFKTLYEKSI